MIHNDVARVRDLPVRRLITRQLDRCPGELEPERPGPGVRPLLRTADARPLVRTLKADR
jgi:hypothetical protein